MSGARHIFIGTGMKILVIKTSSLGDVIHMLPAITDAVRARPELHIDWLVEESFAAIPAWHPAIQQVIPLAMRRWKKHWTARSTWKEISATRAQLKQRSYDLIIDSQGLIKSALWSCMASGTRAGYGSTSAREPLASWFYHRTCTVPRQLHAIDRNRQLMSQILGYALHDPSPDYGLQRLAERLPAPGVQLPRHCVFGLHGTSRVDKLWPTEHWKTLAQALAPTQYQLVLPWGNDQERLRAEDIARHASNVMVLPKLGLDALASLIDQSRAVVGVDTGLLHLAAALGKPGLALYTATPPALTGAISDRHALAPLRNLSTPQELNAHAVTDTLMSILKTP
jgi:heptosyltransferase I